MPFPGGGLSQAMLNSSDLHTAVIIGAGTPMLWLAWCAPDLGASVPCLGFSDLQQPPIAHCHPCPPCTGGRLLSVFQVNTEAEERCRETGQDLMGKSLTEAFFTACTRSAVSAGEAQAGLMGLWTNFLYGKGLSGS